MNCGEQLLHIQNMRNRPKKVKCFFFLCDCPDLNEAGISCAGGTCRREANFKSNFINYTSSALIQHHHKVTENTTQATNCSHILDVKWGKWKF